MKSLYGFRNIIQLFYFCFQETFFVPDDNISFKGFTIYNTDCLKPIGGALILLKSSFPQRKIDLQAELHATVVTLDREITICFVNIPFLLTPNTWTIYCHNFLLPISYLVTSLVTISSGMVKTMIQEVNLSKISLK